MLFIAGVFLIGFLTGGTSALIYSSAKPEPSEVQKTTITNYPIVQRAEPSPEPTEALEEAQEARHSISSIDKKWETGGERF